VAELETLVVRLAHLVARADGEIKPVEAASLKSIQDELRAHLRPIPIDEPDQHASAGQAKAQAVEKVFTTAEQLPPRTRSVDSTPATPSPESLAEALAELESLVGLATIKEEIRTLTNFLKVQAQRTKAGLPAATLSLHMIFGGNPGTGKTSVARIVGRIFGAMGVLKRGHLVETDRSGLVAPYAGQTSPKTHQLIDEALDGVLFIDEAYSLIHPEGDDPYGQEAVQVLLKRMEDDRQRLVVILAGYPTEMQSLIDSNPGLTSRFNRQLQFTDYTPLELAHIFSQMCDKNRYRLAAATRAKTILGLTWLYQHRDERFGNGRAVRNLFEQTIRRQANRIADMKDLSLEELTALEPADIEFSDVPLQALPSPNDEALRFRIECPHCTHARPMPAQYLGQTVQCPKCRKQFTAEWGAAAE
jgi:AAA+ superfamily predicted ATPase